MVDIEALIRPNIRSLKAYSSARDEMQGFPEILLDANENPYNNGYNRYPDPHHEQLKQEIAKKKGVKTNQLILGNGSDELIDMIIRTFCQPKLDWAMNFPPTFSMFQIRARIQEVEIKNIPLLDTDFQLNIDHILKELEKKKYKIIFICSPNNPTGNLIKKDDIKRILSQFNGLVVVDEAYIHFAPTQSLVNEIFQFNNLIVLQTLSKAYGLASIRLGMAFTNPEIIHYLNKVKMPYNISGTSQKIALDALKNEDILKTNIAAIIEKKNELSEKLVALKGVTKVYPSDTNFLLVQFRDAKNIYEHLLKNGIIVRDRSNEVNNTLRITVGTPNENKKLYTLLSELE